jgi:hypothetical protein
MALAATLATGLGGAGALLVSGGASSSSDVVVALGLVAWLAIPFAAALVLCHPRPLVAAGIGLVLFGALTGVGGGIQSLYDVPTAIAGALLGVIACAVAVTPRRPAR